ncbi:hypothetical protein QOT17_002556 [Balamuthia mandrillaris]
MAVYPTLPLFLLAFLVASVYGTTVNFDLGGAVRFPAASQCSTNPPSTPSKPLFELTVRQQLNILSNDYQLAYSLRGADPDGGGYGQSSCILCDAISAQCESLCSSSATTSCLRCRDRFNLLCMFC